MKNDQYRKLKNTIGYYNKQSARYDSGYSAYLENTHNHLLGQFSARPGEKILDVSGGTGLLAKKLLDRYPDIEIVVNDPSEGMRDIAQKRLKNYHNVQFTNHFAEQLSFNAGSFDRVICLNSFHYFTDHQKVIQHIRHCLKPGGVFYILDWNREGWFRLPNAIISMLTPEHINTKSIHETTELLQNYSFEISMDKTWSFRFWKFYLIEGKK